MREMTNGKMSKATGANTNTEKQTDTSPADMNEAYRRGCKLLHEKCKAIQRSNERLVFRLHKVRKMTKTRMRDVELLKARLDSHHDDWRTAPDPTDIKEEGEE
ncbi:TCF3 fusion partner homolog [Anopheles darlingi]|uniref:TCF3 fusion partner homolog n=1 Tax=Anopheles darlingi TaxID=43151 RepID=UPI00210040ED|nr:TCF3 fusion partner homolog [Anopheles darlingi]